GRGRGGAGRGTKATGARREWCRRAPRRQLIAGGGRAGAPSPLGIAPPQRIDEIVQEMMREDERQQQRDFGSLMRWSEAWAQQNLTYDTYEREERTAKMVELTKQMAIGGRLQNQLDLFITPRMMRDTWRPNPANLASPQAIVGVVGFGGRDDKTRALAEEAARVWRAEPLTASELAARFRDRAATSQMTVVVSSSNRPRGLQKELIDFGLAGPPGHVCEPVPAESPFQVWKGNDYAGRQRKAFDQPETQVRVPGLR